MTRVVFGALNVRVFIEDGDRGLLAAALADIVNRTREGLEYAAQSQ